MPRSSPPQILFRKDVLQKRSKFTGDHPCRSVNPIKLHSKNSSHGKFRWGNTMQLPYKTLIKEYIISSNSLSFRKVKQCMHVVCSKTFNMCNYFFFLTRNSQDKATCFMKSLSAKSAHPPGPLSNSRI